MKKLLFICSQNKIRSPTAEQVFATWPGVETDSAGLHNSATIPLSREQIEWADLIFIMEKSHKGKLARRFGRYLNGKRIICLDIPDNYTYMQPELIRLLKTKIGPLLG